MASILLTAALLAVLLRSSVSAEDYAGPRLLPDRASSSSVSAQSIRDVAVLSIAPSSLSASRGTAVSIEVTVQNQGTTDETFILNLRDDTDSRNVSAVSLTLAQGQTLTLGLTWDTGHASAGLHQLSASADLPGDQLPGNNSVSTLSPIEVILSAIILGDGTGLELPDASFGGTLGVPGVVTPGQRRNSVFVGVPGVAFGEGLDRAGVATDGSPHSGFYIANADATFAPVSHLGNPFLRGEFQGVVHLQGRATSSGAYVEIGTERHFVDDTGTFRFPALGGTYDVVIQAPGYVPVRIPNATISSGDLITIPELTLPFGDANGDGKINILDLSIAAGNFGAVVQEMPPP